MKKDKEIAGVADLRCALVMLPQVVLFMQYTLKKFQCSYFGQPRDVGERL